MFKATIKADLLKEAVKAVSVITDEAKFKLTPDGASVSCVDAENRCIVTLNLPKNAFESFEATENILSIDFYKLNRLLDSAEDGEIIELEHEEAINKIHIRTAGYFYSLALLDEKGLRKDPKVPYFELPVCFNVLAKSLKRAIKSAGRMSEWATFGFDGIFYIEAESDIDKVRKEFEPDGETIQIIKNEGNAKSLYTLDYLEDFISGMGKAELVTVELGQDYPIIMGFRLAYGIGDCKYMLAPRVESE